MNVHELYAAGRLSDAIDAATEAVKRQPSDTSARGLLGEFLCFAGQWDRVDKQLDALLQQDPESTLGIAAWRQVLRAEIARQQFFNEGRLPEFTGDPSPILRRHLEASILLREGKPQEAQPLLSAADRPVIRGTCNGTAFEGLEDLDELLSPICEVLTSTGKYFWFPWEVVEHVEFRAPKRPRDLIWRRAHMNVRGGPEGEVYLPALYPGSATSPQEAVRLGHMTDWTGGNGTPLRGSGQRMIRAGQQELAWMDLKELIVDVAA